PDNKYQWITYGEVNERSTNLGSGLVHLGCQPSQNTFIGIYGPNCVEWDLADLACQMHSMISVPIYDTHGAEGCIYIINHADIETIICNGSKLRFLFDNAKQCEKLKRIVKMDGPVTEEEKKEADSLGITILNILEVEFEYLVMLVFLFIFALQHKGTPKGAMMTNANMNSEMAAIQMQYEAAGIQLNENDCIISYLPLAHMYERIAQALCFFNGVRIGFYQGDVKLLLSDIQELKPTIFPSVPRLLTRVYDKVVEGYGQTENAAGATITWLTDTSTGHVGAPLPCNLVKLVDIPEKECYSKDGRGEVCLKGPNVFIGYLKAPEKTAETIDKDGWLHTGDIGEWLPNGTLKIVDRVKHIFKLAQVITIIFL
ncbi:long-chain-fatty-acid--CoA ligase 5-like, partial [Orbicella faveolata]|uniref:long-chain-fatty-acid--CoA ligase 5-like n=1 Tax=Orbicella faveolata TaxID=48498 RepID=UPI0009E1EEDA